MKEIEIQKRAEEAFLKKCTFDDECDLCQYPAKGTYCRSRGDYEYNDDYYWACGKCIEEIINKNPDAREIQLLILIDREEEKAVRESRETKSNQLPF